MMFLFREDSGHFQTIATSQIQKCALATFGHRLKFETVEGIAYYLGEKGVHHTTEFIFDFAGFVASILSEEFVIRED